MLRKWFQRWQATTPDAASLYEAIVARARQPAFYALLDAPDTLMGRFQLLALHVILVIDRLLGLAADAATDETTRRQARELARLLQERMFDEMDAALREMGVSDLGVPKRMQKLAELFFGQMRRYRAALAANDARALQQALARNIYAELEDAETAGAAAGALAALVMQTHAVLTATPWRDLQAGRIDWPAITEGEES